MNATSERAPQGAGWRDATGRSITALFEALGTVAGAIVAAVALAVTADILMRWLIASPIRGMYELSELGVGLGMALAMLLATSRENHVTMEILGSVTGRPAGIRLVGAVLALAVFLLFALFLFEHAAAKTLYRETTYILGLPVGPVWYAIAGLFALTLAAQAAVVLRAAGRLAQGAAFAAEAWAPALILAATAAVAVLFAQAGPAGSGPVLVGYGLVLLALLSALQLPLGAALAGAGLYGLWAVAGPDAARILGGNALAGALSSFDLAALPLFLLMGNFAISAGFAGDVFAAARSLTGRFRGGLALTAILGSGGFGTICGSSVATTAVIGKVAVNEMLDSGYAPRFATGSIAAGGTLGALIPPSVVLIIYCLIAEVSIQKAFIAAIIPAGLAVLLYSLAVVIAVRLRPDLAPEPDLSERFDLVRFLRLGWKPGLLFLTIFGGLYGGIFTVQEAAAVGCAIAFAFWLASGKASWRELGEALRGAAATSAGLYLLFIGATLFGSFLNVADVTTAMVALIDPATMPAWMIIGILVIMYLAIGSIFDAVAAMVVTVPFIVPVLVQMDVDLIWWGIVVLTLVEVGMITPPIGMNVFVMKGVVGDRVSLPTIFRGVLPFLAADAVRIALLLAFPALALWLPGLM